MLSRTTSRFSRRSFFAVTVSAVGAASAIALRGNSSGASDSQVLTGPPDQRHRSTGNVTCSCPICSGYQVDRPVANA